MAYLTEELIQTAAAPAGERPILHSLTPIERNVVLLSLKDPQSSIRPTGSIERLLHFVFGSKRVNGLADERLEAFRQFAVSCRLDGEPAYERALTAAHEAGLHSSEIAAVRLAVGDHLRRHSAHRLSLSSLIAAASTMLISCWLFTVLFAATGDSYVSAILVGMALIITIALLTPRSRHRAR